MERISSPSSYQVLGNRCIILDFKIRNLELLLAENIFVVAYSSRVVGKGGILPRAPTTKLEPQCDEGP